MFHHTVCLTSCAVVALFSAIHVSDCQSADIMFAFTGEVVELENPSSELASNFQIGDLITGNYLFDPTTPSSGSGIFGSEWTGYEGALKSLTANIAGIFDIQLDADGFQTIDVADNADLSFFFPGFTNADAYFVLADVSGTFGTPLTSARFVLNLVPGSSTALASDALPLTPPSIADFPDSVNSFLSLHSGDGTILFKLSSLTLVPEPASLSLFVMLGLACSPLLTRMRRIRSFWPLTTEERNVSSQR